MRRKAARATLPRRPGFWGLLALAFVLLVGATPGSAAEEVGGAPEGDVAGELIVAFGEDVSEAERDEVVAAVGAVEKDEIAEIDAKVVEVDPERTEEAIKLLENDARVEYAERNALLVVDDHPGPPNDPLFHDRWGLHNFGQTVDGVAGTVDADIDALEAWDTTTGSSEVVVAVIDTGVDFGHPDLAGAAWANPGETGGGKESNGIDDDGNGFVDDWRGWDFVNDDNDPFDDHGHGTHVTGTIGAGGDDGAGVAGVSWKVRIMALKALGRRGFGTIADAAKATLYAASNGARITNNSYGTRTFSQAFRDAIEEAGRRGTLTVASAGNTGSSTDLRPNYPASFDAANVVSVAATDSHDVRASFSSFGRETVDIGAPGVDVLSTAPGGDFGFLSGTSMSGPHVAGTAALAKAVFPSATALGLKALLLRTADPNASLAGRTTGGGRLNAARVVGCGDEPQVWLERPADGFSVGVGTDETVTVLAGRCGSAEGVNVTASVNGDGISLTPLGGGLYRATVAVAAEGPVTLSASAASGGATDTMTVSGTAVENYRFEDAPLSFLDASDGGTDTGIRFDDTWRKVDLPFTFAYYGEPFASVKISSNGFLVFGTSSAFSFFNRPLPTRFQPNGVVAPYWDDLNPSRGGSIWTKVVGSAPNRSFVVTWKDVPHFPAVGGVTFSAVLDEGTNDIRFQYADLEFGNRSLDHGASGTVGVENLTGTVGSQFSHNERALRLYTSKPLELRFTTTLPGGGPRVTTPWLPDTTLGQPYGEFLYAAGGTPPYTWSVDPGDLPEGLVLDEGTGEISGIPTDDGLHAFAAHVSDSATPAQTAEKTLAIHILDTEFPGTTISALPFKVTRNTASETPDGPPACGVGATGNAVWYSWTAPSKDTVSLDTFGSRYDTVLAVWEGASTHALTPVACNDDARRSLQSSLTFDAEPGRTYRIQVTSFDGRGGPLALFMRGTALDTSCFPDGWSPLAEIGSAAWWCEENDLIARGTNFDSILVSEDSYGDFELSAKVRAFDREASLAFRLQDQRNTYVLIFIPQGAPPFPAGLFFAVREGGVERYPFFARPFPFPRAGEKAVLGVKATGSTFEITLNGAAVGTVHDATYTSGKVGLRVFGDPRFPVDSEFEDIAVTPLAAGG